MELILPTGFSLSSNTRDQLMSFNNNKEVVGIEEIEEKIIIQFRYVGHTILVSVHCIESNISANSIHYLPLPPCV